MRASASLLALSALTGCNNDYLFTPSRLADTLTLELTSPTYGEYMGSDAITVSGRVSPVVATLLVEGQRVRPAKDGSFEVSLPVDHAYRIVDVEASLDGQQVAERVPVFRGNDPLQTWPGGVTGRLLPAGLTKLGEAVGSVIDGLGWADQINAVLPGYSDARFSFTPVGLLHDPTVVEMESTDEGLEAVFTLNNLTLNYDIEVPFLGLQETFVVGYEQVAVGGMLIPELDEDGLIYLTLSDAVIDLGDPIFELGFLQGWLFDLVVGTINDWIVEPLGELLLDFLLDEVGTIQLGGPFEFEFDLLGTPLEASLARIVTEVDGLGAELGLGIGEPAPTEPLDLAIPGLGAPYSSGAQATLAVHEGILQIVMADALLPYLTAGLDLGGSFGSIIGAGITQLPGGDQAPSGDGWCLSLDPGTAYVARMQEGTDALGTIYLPDFVIDTGIEQGGECTTWLKASLAVELGLKIEDGSKLGLDLIVPEGKILEYGATVDDEAAVVAGLGDYLGTTLGLLAGSLLDFDLADLLGGLATEGGLSLGALEPELVGSAPLLNEDGSWTEGLYAVSIKVWAD
ncbi:MAG: hypothetical protein VX265_01015 [Myxococcota bacterium]|nr:hypothetical protein [Myxococcota bacterium]